LKKTGERFEPWIATWQVVQLRYRGSEMLWKEGGCDPRVEADSVEWHSRQSW
jgi:hypothetical protein